MYLPNIDHLLNYSREDNSDAEWYNDFIKNISLYQSWGSHSYTEIQKTLKEENLNSVILHKGDRFKVGDALFEVLWQEDDTEMPDKNVHNSLHFMNNSSLVTRVTLGGVRYLTAGDIYKSVEQKMIEAGVDLKADIVKTNHHSNRSTSNCSEFFAAVDAAWAFGTGESSATCVEGTSAAKTNYVNLKNNGQITFTIYKGEINMFGQKNLKMVNRLYWSRRGEVHMKTFWFDKEQAEPCFRASMLPEGAEYLP